MLYDFLTDRAPAILEHAGEAVRRASLGRYEADGAPRVHERLERLLDLVLESVRHGHVGPMVSHAARVARERFDAGFPLYEVQTAFNVLEEAVWLRVLEDLPAEEQVAALGLVSTILGAGKDVLAREYVALAGRSRPAVADPGALMRGT